MCILCGYDQTAKITQENDNYEIVTIEPCSVIERLEDQHFFTSNLFLYFLGNRFTSLIYTVFCALFAYSINCYSVLCGLDEY